MSDLDARIREWLVGYEGHRRTNALLAVLDLCAEMERLEGFYATATTLDIRAGDVRALGVSDD